MHARLVTLGLAGGIAALACPGPIAAQPAETPADVLFRQGRELMTARKYAEACAAFDDSQKLKPDIGTLLNQANCREKKGELATAWRLFADAERQTREATDEPTRELHRVAAERAAKLEARLRLEIPRPVEPVSPDTWSKAVPDDWSDAITVGVERDLKTIEVPKLAPTAPTPVRVRPRAIRDEPAPAAPRRWILPLAFAGGAVGFLGGAAGFVRWGDRTYSRAEAATDVTSQTSLWHSANQKRYIAEAMLGAGIGCAGVAVWLWLRQRPASPPASASRNREVAVAPLVDADLVGMNLGGRW